MAKSPRSRSVHGVVVQALSGRACLRPRASTHYAICCLLRLLEVIQFGLSRLYQGESRFAQDSIQIYYTSCSSPEPISVFVMKADAEEPRSFAQYLLLARQFPIIMTSARCVTGNLRIREDICNLGSVGKPGVIFTGLDPTVYAGGGVCCTSTDAMACEAPVCSSRPYQSESAVILCFRNPVFLVLRMSQYCYRTSRDFRLDIERY